MSTHDGWPARTPVTDSSVSESPGTTRPDVARGPARTAPTTGDAAIDAVLDELDAATHLPLARHIEAGERVHEVLRERLSDLGGA